ncbi:MAG: DpnI domain-containing protein [Methylotenera sp.]|nr:DpnI domain-containing protein [Methylotenera sp.]
MNLQMNVKLAGSYTSASQKIRVITESWLADFGYCPTCGNDLKSAKANSKVFDFECVPCAHEFELKSKRAVKTVSKICDGAYSAMMQRIIEPNSPNFFFLGYDASFSVTNLLAVPNYFFQPSVIEKRNPLSSTAKRAGWVGCNILLDQIPEIGKIKLVENGEIISQEKVLKTWQKTAFLAQQNKIEARGWTLDVMKCIERVQSKEFSLETLYKFEAELAGKHPHNRFVKDKIRQQLQVLRDKEYLEFVKPGYYKLME